MKRFTAITSAMLLIAMIFALLCTGVSAADDKVSLKNTITDGSYADGGYYAFSDGTACTKYGTDGITFSSTFRGLWAFTNATVEAYPYLYYKVADNSQFKPLKITVSKNWDVETEIELEIKDGENFINLYELLDTNHQTTVGYSYIVIYGQGADCNIDFEYFYLSNVDQDGVKYEKPVQPAVPEGDPSKMIKFQLGNFTEDNTTEGLGYQWLMSRDENNTEKYSVKITPNGNGFTMERDDSYAGNTVNIAWVVPYEQLATTPYLAVEIGNEGRNDEGPRTFIYPYWEHVANSQKLFDILPAPIGANSLNGTTKFPLKYAVDSVKENLHGPDGIAIILSITIDSKSDGTTLEPLQVLDAYLFGYEEGGEDYTPPVEDETNDVSSEVITSEDSSAIVIGGDDKGEASGVNVALIVIIAVAAVAVIAAAVVAVIIIKKKKTNN